MTKPSPNRLNPSYLSENNWIEGKWYPKDSSTQYTAHLIADKTRYEIHIVPNKQSEPLKEVIKDNVKKDHKLTGRWSEVIINDRLGNTERKLILADGSLFTTQDNEAVDRLINSDTSDRKGSKWNLRLHRHETKMSSVLMMLVLTIGFVFGFIKWGLPWTSQTVAHALPQSTGEYIGKQSLDVIDKYFLQPTKISEAQQQKIISRFETRLQPLGGDDRIHYQLHFRDMSINGLSVPNAFALPSGDIVLTDKFVELSDNNDEMDSVLLHEMGHVVERHSLEMLTQNSLTTMIVMLVIGNPDGLSELTTGLGTALVSNHYSRQYETEADEFAFKKMLEIGINPQSFVTILSRMEDYSSSELSTEEGDGTKHIPEEDQAHDSNSDDPVHDNSRANADNTVDDTTIEEDSLSDFLSTHPNTQLRIKMADRYSSCFEQGLTVCE